MTELEAIYHLHSGIPREAPGSDDATRDALRRLPSLRPSAKVLDVGCGPGRSTLVLAHALQTPIIAVDVHEPYLSRLSESAGRAGLADLVITRRQRMEDIAESAGTIDLIWAEGSIYIMGFADGLRRWHPLLRPGGCVALTEVCWLVDDPPAEVKAFWQEAYPAIGTIESNMATAVEAGFDVLDHFVLPQEAWWDEYLTPLAARIGALESESAGNAMLARVIEEQQREIQICRQYLGTFGYVFFLLRKSKIISLGKSPFQKGAESGAMPSRSVGMSSDSTSCPRLRRGHGTRIHL